jgi:HlyD family secretion protein
MAVTRKIGKKRILIGIGIAAAILIAWQYVSGKNGRVTSGGENTYNVTHQDLTISVTESGSIKASNSVTVRSGVEGRTTIVSVVPEGTILTQEDVDKGKVILELDTSTQKEDLNRQQIEYNTAMADFTDAKENLDIQINQNESDIQQGRLTVQFALMDLQKYVGQEAADGLVADSNSRTITDNDFNKLTRDPNKLGGESLQKYRQLMSDITVAQSEYYLAQNTLNWTEKLAAKNYVAKTELESDKLKADKSKITHEQAITALDLFVRYEFPKDSHKFFSDYAEAKRELERILAKARSQEAQAVAKKANAEAKFGLEKERLEKLQRQVAAGIIKAPVAGMVVYATQGGGRFGGSRSRTSIEVGREVQEREDVMSIPSAMEMAVDTKIHETNVDKVMVGQRARITVDAMPDQAFYGSVLKISPLPDPAAFLSNPDLKVYSTDVSIENSETLRPGMSAKVEIVIAQLKNVIAIPVQCISNRAGKKICFLQTRNGNEEREVKTGPYNDKFIQIQEGLNEGEKVLLSPPRIFDQAQDRPIPDGMAPAVAPQGGTGDSQRPRRQRSNGQGMMDGQQGGWQPDSSQGDSPRPRRQRPDGQTSMDGQQSGGQTDSTRSPQADSQRPQRMRPDGQSPAGGQPSDGQAADSPRPRRQRPDGGAPGTDTPREPQQ